MLDGLEHLLLKQLIPHKGLALTSTLEAYLLDLKQEYHAGDISYLRYLFSLIQLSIYLLLLKLKKSTKPKILSPNLKLRRWLISLAFISLPLLVLSYNVQGQLKHKFGEIKASDAVISLIVYGYMGFDHAIYAAKPAIVPRFDSKQVICRSTSCERQALW
ncbi:MAG: hypothetical protein R2880_03560 [Deinococcales bacterium]